MRWWCPIRCWHGRRLVVGCWHGRHPAIRCWHGRHPAIRRWHGRHPAIRRWHGRHPAGVSLRAQSNTRATAAAPNETSNTDLSASTLCTTTVVYHIPLSALLCPCTRIHTNARRTSCGPGRGRGGGAKSKKYNLTSTPSHPAAVML